MADLGNIKQLPDAWIWKYGEGVLSPYPNELISEFIKKNEIANIGSGRVFMNGDVIVIVDVKNIEDNRISNFIKNLKHGEADLMNVVFLSGGEWESLKNFCETIGYPIL